jgi:hypothetical protein
MKGLTSIALCALVLPAVAAAATRTYDVAGFEEVRVSAGISADIRIGSSQSVVAEIKSGDFADLQIEVDGKVLKIGRPQRGWLSAGRRPDYHVHIVTPALRSLHASSGADAKILGSLAGDFAADASSGADIDVADLKGEQVRLEASSSGHITIAGSCTAVAAEASSGSDIDAGGLKCMQATVQASSGSDISVSASNSVTGGASSGADIRIAGGASVVQVSRSSGADVVVVK